MSLKLNPHMFLILKLYFSALIPFAITYLHISILNYCESNRTIPGLPSSITNTRQYPRAPHLSMTLNSHPES